MPENAELDHYLQTFLARQPVFNKEKQVFGYELLFRDSDIDHARFTDQQAATMEVTASMFSCLEKVLQNNKQIMINFPSDLVVENIPYALPANRTIVEITGDNPPSDALLHALKELKKQHYSVSIDDYQGQKNLRPLLELCDIVKIDILGKDEELIKKTIAAVNKPEVQLLAKRVETGDLFELAKTLGFSWFQGFFFQKPENIKGRKLTSNEILRLKLIKMIEQEDMDIDQLAEVIQADVSISYRLLAFLNSAAFGFTQQISSIRHAITLLGWMQLKNWLRIIILTDIVPKEKTRELSYTSILRAKFLENVASEKQSKDMSPNDAFFLGLFSLLEALLDTPMQDVVDLLPLRPEIKTALCTQDNTAHKWLEMATCFESANWKLLDTLMHELELESAVVAKSYHMALEWGESFFGKAI